MVAKKDEMYRKIREHGKNLIRIFKLAKDTDPVKLCRKLHKLEKDAHDLTTMECNTGQDHQVRLDKILAKVKKILFPGDIEDRELYLAVFVNGDCRGYALKIRSEYCHDKTIYRDWGGYGIIAPDFSEGGR